MRSGKWIAGSTAKVAANCTAFANFLLILHQETYK